MIIEYIKQGKPIGGINTVDIKIEGEDIPRCIVGNFSSDKLIEIFKRKHNLL